SAAEQADSADEASSADDASAASASPTDPPTEEYVAPQPDGTYTSSCDYLLGDFTESESGFRFVADAQLRNTGNIGTITKVTVKWFLAGGDKIKEQKKVRMKPGTSRRVGFKHIATADEIDRHQALGYSGKTCVVKAALVDTFGEPQGP